MAEYRNHSERIVTTPEYCRHVSAMTGEDLHSKADIAEELAWRDIQIERLRHQLARTEEALLAAQSDARSAWSSCRAADKDIERLRGQKVALLTASQAVIDRWHTPSWKDVPATAGYIMLLEHAVAEVHGV